MIQFDRVTLAFSDQVLFENASFTLQKKHRYGLVGRNGSGKSTLFRLINGEIEPDHGSIGIPKDYRIGYLEQHIHFIKPTLLQEAALGLPVQEREDLYKAEKILFGLGFTEKDLEAMPNTFSGGFQLRLHLAKVLLSEPDCLLLDEPTNYLDILSIRWLKNFLSKWSKECILISHDRDFMDAITTHTMGIHREKIKKVQGSSIDFFQQVLLEEEVHEKTRIKMEKKKAHMQSFIERFGSKASKAAQAQSKKKKIEREPVLEKLNDLSNLSFSFHEAFFPGKKMLEAKQIHFSFSEKPFIHDFSLEIRKGERIAIIGKNGRGKSTILRVLTSELEPQQGIVEISENTKVGYFGQTHIDRLNAKHTIETEISLANPSLNFVEIKAIAGNMMFSQELSEKKISVLSGGEKSRVLLGKIVAKPCNLLLLDEPTHHLDIESVEALIDALEEFSGAVVLVTHSELILRRLSCDKILLCGKEKQTLFLGNYDEFLEKVGWEEEIKKSSTKKNVFQKQEEKAATLKPIERRIRECEKKIISLESKQKDTQNLIDQGNHSKEILESYSFVQKEIQQNEKILYELYELFEKKKKEFEE